MPILLLPQRQRVEQPSPHPKARGPDQAGGQQSLESIFATWQHGNPQRETQTSARTSSFAAENEEQRNS